MAESPALAAIGPLGIAIEIDGAPQSDEVAVMSVEVRSEVGRIAECTIKLMDGDVATQEFPLTDDAKYAPGGAIKVKVHYGDDPADEIFAGMIVGIRTQIMGGDSPSTLILDCRATAAKLHQVRKSALYIDKKDSDIASQIAGEAGVPVQVDATTATHKQALRSDCTDWEYLRLLAERNGLLIWCDGDTLRLEKPAVSGGAVLALTYGVDIFEVDLEISAQRAYGEAQLKSWDITSQRAREVSGSRFSGSEWGNLPLTKLADVLAAYGSKGPAVASAGDLSADALQAHADAVLQGIELGRITGLVRFTGSALAKPNTVVDVAGLSERLNGKAFVNGVAHRLDAEGWVTTAQLGAVPQYEGFGPRRPPVVAAGVATPIHGLQVGVVMKLDEDPDAMARIQIALPMVSGAETGIWARLASPYAGNGMGIDFLPEVGDEVIVGFMGGDPSSPVILGAVHSSGRMGPVTAEAENNLKIIQTRSGIKLTFDDDRKAVTIDTPGGAQVTLDDNAKVVTLKDQHGNKIDMASAGITLKSPKDITLDATGAVAIKAASDVTIKGLNVTAEAQASATLKGSASAEVSASGTMTIKGAMVMIN